MLYHNKYKFNIKYVKFLLFQCKCTLNCILNQTHIMDMRHYRGSIYFCNEFYCIKNQCHKFPK